MVQHHSSTWSAGSSCKRPVLSVAAALVVLIVVNVLLFGELPAFDHHGGAEAEVANVRGSTVLERVSGGSTTPAALDSEQQNVELNVDEMAPTVPLPTYDIDMDNSIYPGPDDDDDRYFDAELYEASDSVVEATADVNDLLVETRQGRIRGKVAGKVGRVRAFLGLPYAAPPTGDLRWRAPQEPARWPDSVIRKATAHGPSCPQVNILEYQSEDCLFVDIYTPSANRFGVVTGGRRRRLPVMLWIHGGAWVMGSRDFLGVQNPLYIVEHRDVVVVTMNYRLGPLGFMVGARNGTDPIDRSTIDGNFGLLDQRAAMKWVQENIAQFGGDPESVTLWGESAGAMSIGFHLTSPGSEGLFHRVIMESNVLGVRYRTRDEAAHIGEELARKIGCEPHDVACMRKVPAAKVNFVRSLMRFHNQRRLLSDILVWTPVVDGVDFPGQPLDLIRAGRIHNMPILIGFNRDEAGFLVGVIGTILGKLVDNPAIPLLNARTYRVLIGKLFHEAAPEILLAYPPRPYDTRYNLDQVIQIAGDYLVTCPTFDTLDAIGAHRQNDAPRQQHPIYVYSFNFAANFLPIWLLPRCRKRNICHAMELPFVFHTVRGFLERITEFSPKEHAISHAIIDYWTAFAAGDYDAEHAQGGGAAALQPHPKSMDEYDHDYDVNKEHPLERIPWHPYHRQADGMDAAMESMQAAPADNDRSWLLFTDDARIEMRRDEFRPELCAMWRRLGREF